MTFVARHINERVGDFAGRRRKLDEHDVAWVLAWKRDGLSNQNIANMGGMSLEDVQRILESHHVSGPVSHRRQYVPSTRPALPPSAPKGPSYSDAFACRLASKPGTFGPSLVVVPPRLKTWKEIVRDVARRHRVRFEEILGPSRAQPIAGIRQEAMWELHQQDRWSLPQIGRFLGNRDHTTVLHGVRRHAERLAEAEAERVAA